jgi:hypothetical protein
MCSGPVGDKQSYWGLIQIKIAGSEMSAAKLDEFKQKLTDFLSGKAVSADLPLNAKASLANGTIKTDDTEDGASIQLVNRK